MTINNPEKFVAGLWDWGTLDGCFGDTKIMPTDLDGFVERNGKFLVLETKAPGVEVKRGQQLTFERLVSTGVFTVVLVWGDTNKPCRVTVMTRQTTREYTAADMGTLRWIVSSWFQWANRNFTPPPTYGEATST